jgi:sulfoxide reductase heme-binding subunit YedZ
MRGQKWRQSWSWWQIVTHLGALLPLIIIIWDYWHDQLTVNPIQELTLRTGWYALILLILSLTCTPLNTLLGLRQLLPLRKPLGLYAFMYAAIHFLIFVGLDYGFNLAWILEATFEKRYALVGFAAFVILTLLALTSTQGWQRRLGKNWKRLHRWVYLAALLVSVHFYMLVKVDVRRPLAYGAVIALLLLARTPWVRKQVSKVRGQFGWSSKKRVVTG